MTLLDSLLDAMLRLDGDALVMHVGEKPYVITSSDPSGDFRGALARGRVELSSRVLTSDAVAAMLNQLLPLEERSALDAIGATEYSVEASGTRGHFTIVAGREGKDVWLEIRRRAMDPGAATAQGARGRHSPQNVSRAADSPGVPASGPAGVAAQADHLFDQEPDEPDDVMTEGELGELLSPAAPSASGDASVAARRAAVVVPLARGPRPDPAAGAAAEGMAAFHRLLHRAASTGADSLHLAANSEPVVRVNGVFGTLDGAPPVDVALIERLASAPGGPAGLPSAPGGAVCVDVDGVGRVRCVPFRDHRGPGLTVRLLPPRLLTPDELGLTPDVQALSSEADGLVLIAGARRSGRSTLLAALLDSINRTRTDYVITAESRIEFVHVRRLALISQREALDDIEQLERIAAEASREEPDVLVIDEIRTPALVTAALECAEAGGLVLAVVEATTATAAVERLLEMATGDRRAAAQSLLAGVLRGVVAQALLRKRAGGRVTAREILLSSPLVTTLILEGRTAQLQAAMDAGRQHGMVPFSASLAALVRDGTVHPSHAWRKAPQRDLFLAALRRDGFDTTVLERYA